MGAHRKGRCACGAETHRRSATHCARCKPNGTDRGAKHDGFTAEGDRAEVSRLTGERVRSLEDLIRVCDIDTDEWVVERWVANKWESASAVERGTGADKVRSVEVTPLFQVKAWLSRNRPVLDAKAKIAALKADAAKALPPRPFVRRQPAGAYMLELMCPDLHLGKLAWADETGYQHYDSKIAEQTFRAAIEALVHRTSAFRFERIVFPVGNDFFHSDTKAGTTTKGTPLDNDGRFQKMYQTGRRMIVEAVERLRQLAPVEVVMVPGNHDSLTNFTLGDSLECWFRATDDVTIRNEPTQRKYVQHGRNMILFAHGDKGKLDKDYPLLMAREQPEMWGSSLHREVHTGDKHQSKVTERMGVRTRIFSALCPPDAWHSDNLFVGNERQADALVWHPIEGIVTTATYTVIE